MEAGGGGVGWGAPPPAKHPGLHRVRVASPGMLGHPGDGEEHECRNASVTLIKLTQLFARYRGSRFQIRIGAIGSSRSPSINGCRWSAT
jgi:hypothetical protein